MKPRTIITAMLALLTMSQGAAQDREKTIEPQSIIDMPKITKGEWEKLEEGIDEGDAPQDISKYGDLTVFEDLYSGRCSWYCGGEVKSVVASSCLAPVGSFDYKGENAHDFSHERPPSVPPKGGRCRG